MGDEGEFVPLQVALAWAYTRSDTFTSLIQGPWPLEVRVALFDIENPREPLGGSVKEGLWPIEVAFAKFNDRHNLLLQPVIGSVQEAWHVLRHRIFDDKLQILGIPFVHRAARGIPSIGWHQLRQFPVQIQDLLHLELLARAPGLRGGHTWWEEVVIEKIVLDFFPEKGSVTDKPGKPKTTPKKLTAKYRYITRAIDAHWPEGDVMDEPISSRNKLIKDWVFDNVRLKDGTKGSVSLSTIDRYFEDFEAGKIDGF
jgi:hypothetical protein